MLLLGLGLGVIFGLLFFGIMALVVHTLETKTAMAIRKSVAMHGKIYFEGSANRAGNGGWLFVTENGIEHCVHKANFNSAPTSLSHSEIISIRAKGKKLEIITEKTTYTFVVNNIAQWMSLFKTCELTKNKL